MTVGVPVAAAAPVVPAIRGPLRTATVLGVLSAAVVLDAGDRLLILLGPGATAVPNGVRLPISAWPTPAWPIAAWPPVTVGDSVTIGEGRIVLSSSVFTNTVSTNTVRTNTVLTLVRTWRTAVAPVTPDPAKVRQLAARVEGADRGLPLCAVDDLRRAVVTGSDPAAAVAGLVGLGIGLTPGGDDVLCGAMVGLHATGRSGTAQALAAAVDLGATTRVSADLLRLAADGHACLELLALLTGLQVASGPDTVARAARGLLAVGHTSGADLATGLLLGLGAPTAARVHSTEGRAA